MIREYLREYPAGTLTLACVCSMNYSTNLQVNKSMLALMSDELFLYVDNVVANIARHSRPYSVRSLFRTAQKKSVDQAFFRPSTFLPIFTTK
jgi:hypothetical protein